MTKKLILGLILADWAHFWAAKFFSPKNLVASVIRYHGHLSSGTISEKTNDPILRILVRARRTTGWTDGQESLHWTLSD